MINELYQLSQALKNKGLLQSVAHKDIKEPARQAGLLIEINKKKQPVSIEYLMADDFIKLWKHSKGNHNSFPIIRIQKPIIKHSFKENFDNEWKKKNNDAKNAFLAELNFDKMRLIEEVEISKWTKEQLVPICKKTKDLEALGELISRFPDSDDERKAFFKKIDKLIVTHSTSFNVTMTELIKDILIGSWDAKKNKFVSKTQVAFDINDPQNYKYRVKDSRLKAKLVQELILRDFQNNSKSQMETCYLSGQNTSLYYIDYPQVKLPVLGLTYIYSNNKDIQCQTRYKMQAQQSFKASNDIVSEMNNALVFVVGKDDNERKEKEGKTWIQVPGIKNKELNLLIAYVNEFPESNTFYAKMMGDVPSYEQNSITFQELTMQVIGSLKGKTEINQNAHLQIFVLNKVDDGRKQILFSNSYDIKTFMSGTDKWQEAFQNCSIVQFRTKVKGEDKIIEPQCPYPAQAVKFMQNKWSLESQDGKRQLVLRNIPGITLREIYDVFIPIENERLACQNLLSKMTLHSHDLIIIIGHLKNNNELYKAKIGALYDCCLAVSFLSILLYKLDYKKEVYMHEVAFNIGRLMKLSDILHREYCVKVRDGGIPPQLIGNSIMATAAEFPNRALDQLRERIRIYQAWANKTPEEGVANRAVKKMGDVSLELSANTIPDTFSEAERAQVLLGYLAKIEE